MVETERASSRRIRQIRRGFLYLEAVAAALLLPAAARFSGDLLRGAAGVVLSPRFVFLLGNAIVLLLFRGSGRLISSSSSAPTGDVVSDLLDHRHSDPPLLQEEEEEEEEEKEENVAVDEVVEEEESPELRREEEEESDDVEFRRTVEAFIDRQLRFRRQESMESVFSATDTLEIVPVMV